MPSSNDSNRRPNQQVPGAANNQLRLRVRNREHQQQLQRHRPQQQDPQQRHRPGIRMLVDTLDVLLTLVSFLYCLWMLWAWLFPRPDKPLLALGDHGYINMIRSSKMVLKPEADRVAFDMAAAQFQRQAEIMDKSTDRGAQTEFAVWVFQELGGIPKPDDPDEDPRELLLKYATTMRDEFNANYETIQKLKTLDQLQNKLNVIKKVYDKRVQRRDKLREQLLSAQEVGDIEKASELLTQIAKQRKAVDAALGEMEDLALKVYEIKDLN